MLRLRNRQDDNAPEAWFGTKFPLFLPMLLLCCLNGCAVGVFTVEGPQLPQSKNPFHAVTEVYFEVCEPPELRRTGFKKHLSEKIASVLRKDPAIRAHQERPAIDKPYLHFLIASKTDTLYTVSGFLSFLSLSAIPGYIVDRTRVDMPFALMDANGAIIRDSYRYEYRDRYFLWLPLVFNPDVIMGVNGGYINESKENKGLELVLTRFLYDVSERVRQKPAVGENIAGLPALQCPEQ